MKISVSKIHLTAYLLTFIGYMTLTLSLTLTPYLANSLKLLAGSIEIGISLSFFMFSASAIVFATLSDIYPAKRVLMVSQLISITGLLCLGFSSNNILMYIGFFLLGLGTGCYSSISRALITRNTPDKNQLKRSFAIISTCIILAPVISSYLVLTTTEISWRLAYFVMAFLETSLLFYSNTSLKTDAKTQILIAKKQVFTGITHALSQSSYVINVIICAFMFSFFLGVLMSSFKGLVINELKFTIQEYSLLFLLSSLSYIAGVFTFRFIAHKSHKKRYNFGIIGVIFIAIIIYTFFRSDTYILVTLYVICYLTGFLVPSSSSNAMSNITKGHGSAAALLTFSIAFSMSIWEFVRAHTSISDYHFILLSLWVTFLSVLVLKTIYKASKD